MPANFTGSLAISGSLLLTGSITATGGITISGSILSASYASNAELLDGLDSSVFVQTGSFNSVSSSFVATSASLSTRVTTLEAASSSLNTASGSLSTRVTNIEGNYATTGSNVFTGAQTVCANITSTGTIVAQTLNVQQVTSSIVYSCGSNIFGCSTSDVQQFTGSVRITGSLNVAGNTCVTSICSPAYVGGTFSGTTIYGSTAICGAVICGGATTLTGALSGTSATFSGNMVLGTTALSGGGAAKWITTDGSTYGGGLISSVNGTAKAYYYYDTSGYAYVQGVAGVGVKLLANNVDALTIASTGAATFSSSVTAGGLNTTSYSNAGSTVGAFIVNTASSTLNNSANLWFGTWGGSSVSGITNARISALNVDAGNAATDLLFYTYNGSSSGERMRITSAGIACFACQVCAPTLLTNGYVFVNGEGNGLLVEAGTAATARTGFMKYGGYEGMIVSGNTTKIRLAHRTDCDYVYGGTPTIREDLVIFASGIACFACQVCAPSGVKFGGGGGVLNYYEEGTFTPCVAGSTSAGTATYSAQCGLYTRIGRAVSYNLYVDWNSGNGTGCLRITNLPFTSNTNTVYPAAAVGEMSNIALLANNVITARVNPNTTEIYATQYPVGGGAANQVVYDGAGYIVLSGTYFV